MSTGVSEFGFHWGPMKVTRICHVADKGRLLAVSTGHDEIEVWVSEKGRVIRVFRDGKELSC